jgi:hypothetical protein
MKLLQNPIVVGLLAAAAIGAVTWSSLSGKSRRSKSIRPSPTVAAAPTAPTAAPPPPAVVITNLVPIDKTYARLREPEWIQSPRRDPFGLKQTVQRPEGAPVLSAVLNGIWRQGTSYLAVVNQRVVQEGDSVGEFIVHRIEFDRVLFRGPSGVEELQFKPHRGEVPQARPDFARNPLHNH